MCEYLFVGVFIKDGWIKDWYVGLFEFGCEVFFGVGVDCGRNVGGYNDVWGWCICLIVVCFKEVFDFGNFFLVEF